MDRKSGDDNYDAVNMDMSDSGESDNGDMFANKKEYEAFQQHFSTKSKDLAGSGPAGEYGGEYGGDGGEYGGQESEYGSGSNRISAVGGKFGHAQTSAVDSGSNRDKDAGIMSVGDKKVERKAMLYGDKDRKRRSPERRSKSRDRHRRDRSRSREDRRKRSRSRDRDRDRRRSRSRSPGRGGRGNHRGGWGRDRDRDNHRRRDREEAARNHEEQTKKAREMGVEIPKYLKPGAVNPLSYAEQMQKRKALWSKPASASANPQPQEQEEKAKPEVVTEAPPSANVGKKAGGSFNNWESTNFGNDKMNERFRRLMGIKGGNSNAPSATADNAAAASNKIQGGGGEHNHDKIMNDLDRNYEAARQQTHRNRGIGLGFSDSGLAPSVPEPQGPPPMGNNMRNSGWVNRGSGGINFVKKQ